LRLELCGLDEYLQKIKDGWTDVDVIITMPSVMGKLGPLGRILGPRGFNPKKTVTMDVAKLLQRLKLVKSILKLIKLTCRIGKVSFGLSKLLTMHTKLFKHY
jgi:large subunit ribosomal protein L1